jgi:hypothetical protein
MPATEPRLPKSPPADDQKRPSSDLSEDMLAEHNRSKPAAHRAASWCRGKAPTGHVPSSRCQTPAGPQRNPRIQIRPDAAPRQPDGGARRDRTDDLKLAKLALSQLSYGPILAKPAASPFGPPGPQGRPAARAVARESQGDGRRRRRLRPPRMVGLGRLERPTSPLSGVRSNHLSYRPGGRQAQGPAPVRKDD